MCRFLVFPLLPLTVDPYSFKTQNILTASFLVTVVLQVPWKKTELSQDAFVFVLEIDRYSFCQILAAVLAQLSSHNILHI